MLNKGMNRGLRGAPTKGKRRRRKKRRGRVKDNSGGCGGGEKRTARLGRRG